MPPQEKEVVVSGAAGLGAAVASESGAALGEIEIKARGYWELVWIRFRRDKVAIASGIFIILLILVAFVGAPIAEHYLGHGPDDIFTGTPAVTPGFLPAGPMTWIDNFYLTT